MAKLKRMQVSNRTESSNREILIDWDNDRHQSIRLQDDTPDALIKALYETIDLLSIEIREKNI